MISQDSLPVILVSAIDRQTAEILIADVVAESESRVLDEGGCVWTIQNKYYTADVRMVPLGDGDPAPACDPSLIEAHLIYLTKAECADASAWSSRAAAAACWVEGASVAVCACAGGVPGAGTDHLGRYEPVSMQAGGGDEEDGEWGDERGVSRVRAALHAHTWRGLRRRGEAGGGGGGGEWSAAGVESWAGVMEAAAAAARLPPAERRRHADALLPTLQAALQAMLDDDC